MDRDITPEQLVMQGIRKALDTEGAAARARAITSVLRLTAAYGRLMRDTRGADVDELYEGAMTMKEIGQEIGISTGRVQHILSRGAKGK